MMSKVKTFAFELFRWFVNFTGFLKNPDKVANRLIIILFAIFMISNGVTYFTDVGEITYLALSIIGVSSLVSILGVMLIGVVLKSNSPSSLNLQQQLDESQTRLDSYTDD